MMLPGFEAPAGIALDAQLEQWMTPSAHEHNGLVAARDLARFAVAVGCYTDTVAAYGSIGPVLRRFYTRVSRGQWQRNIIEPGDKY